MAVFESSTLKTGQRPVLKQEKQYKPGEDLFVEGERGNELFVIQEGQVEVLKKTEDGSMISLVKLERGTTIGEMALLDDMPRSATVRAVKPTKVTVINRLAFNAVLEKVPLWLRSIVKVVTSRLRDSNARVGKSILRDNECGLCNLIILMTARFGKPKGESTLLSYNIVRNFMMFTSRMTSKNFKSALEILVKRSLLGIEKDTEGGAWIAVKDSLALKMFVEYRKLKAQGKKMIGADLNDKHIEFLTNIGYVSQKSGKQTIEGMYLPLSAIDFGEEKENRRMLGELEKKNVLSLTMAGQISEEEGILYQKNIIGKVKKLKTLLPVFEKEITAE